MYAKWNEKSINRWLSPLKCENLTVPLWKESNGGIKECINGVLLDEGAQRRRGLEWRVRCEEDMGSVNAGD